MYSSINAAKVLKNSLNNYKMLQQIQRSIVNNVKTEMRSVNNDNSFQTQ